LKNIYLIKAVSASGDVTYKVGKTTRDPKKRLKELQTGNPNKLDISYIFESQYANLLETTLHIHYKPYRLEGEWFMIDDEQVNKFGQVCQKYEENLKILHEQNSYFQNKKRL
jgi:hypothetical protein